MSAAGLVETRRDGDVAIVAINRPDVLNALSGETVSALIAAITEATTGDDAARCLVFTGNGRAFCSGNDLAASASIRANGRNRADGMLQRLYHPLLRLLRDCPVPTVAAVNGPAVGAGMSLALMGDLVTMSADAYLLQAFARIGLVPDTGSSWILPRLVGPARARELAMLGERLPAARALEWGLVNRVFDAPSFMDGTLEIARRLAAGPTRALVRSRRMFWASGDNGFEQQLDLEDAMQFEAGKDSEFREGVTAFMEKRAPRFSGL